jgi:hypothetical protein
MILLLPIDFGLSALNSLMVYSQECQKGLCLAYNARDALQGYQLVVNATLPLQHTDIHRVPFSVTLAIYSYQGLCSSSYTGITK